MNYKDFSEFERLSFDYKKDLLKKYPHCKIPFGCKFYVNDILCEKILCQ